MSRATRPGVAALVGLTLLAAACSSGDDDTSSDAATTGAANTATSTADDAIDHAAIGLWDDGPCNADLPPLKVGLTTLFESPVLSLGDHAKALEASADAFNARGGANGACIEVHTCDDGGNLDQAVGCVRELDDAGVVATINDQTTAGLAEVSEAMVDAGIARIGSNVVPEDWAAPNMFPLDASGTGSVFMMPQALIDSGVEKIGVLRPDLAEASALIGLLRGVYEGKAELPADIVVTAGTTDYSQFVLGADQQGVDGIELALGEQEAVQVVRSAEQLDSDLTISATLAAFPHSRVADLGDTAEKMVFVWSYPPATAELPVYDALRADLAASGDEELQPENLSATAMRSWIGLYGLLKVIRDSGTTDFTRESVTELLNNAKDVPMLGMLGDENWTPALDHPGAFKRAGMNTWGVYRWDPDADAPGDLEGNFVQSGTLNFDEVLCGSPFGAPPPC